MTKIIITNSLEGSDGLVLQIRKFPVAYHWLRIYSEGFIEDCS